MSPSKINTKLSKKIITLDIETFIYNNLHIPYCISLFFKEGKLSRSKSFISNPISFDLNGEIENNKLFDDLFKYLFTSQFHEHIIYIHNSSSFDMIFLLKKMIPYVINVKPIIKDNKFINLEVYYEINKKTYKIIFRDSYLLLPSSLSKLSKAFNNDNIKGIFPYNFISLNNLLYEGIVPDYIYFDQDKVTLEEYLTYKNDFINKNKHWNLSPLRGDETIKYCEQDCKSLFEVIINFQLEIFNEFSIDITKTPTLPSLAFKIFRTHYLKINQVPIINKVLFKTFSQAYYGGHVDMYIPKGPLHDSISLNNKSDFKNLILNKLIYHYDINSLYPTGMKYLNFPTGNITYFIPRSNDSLNLINDELELGIYRVKINCPKDLMHPIIPIKINNACVYPIGSWQGWYQSDELNNAKKFGYTFEIFEGYLFESNPIFKDYIERLYEMKVNSKSNSPKYIISKMLMNSLYGRFAMNPNLLSHEIVDKINNNKSYEDVVELQPGKYLVSYFDDNQTDNLKINIAIGLTVTSYARIIMSKFKNNFKLTGNLYYTDTDSAFIDKMLQPIYIGKELGLMKLEHTLVSFIALAPKVYGGILEDGSSFTKVKGLKNKIPFTELNKMLHINNKNLHFTQEKWYRKLIDGSIEVKQIPYILTPTENKRQLIYENNYLIKTAAIELNNGIIIKSSNNQ